jgi:cytosine/adenosine deaminase-related metal-dependent hydrolase
MIRKITADVIYPISSAPIENGVVVTDENGKILEISPRENHDSASLEYHPGAIVPGFINTHCHLELSHMKGMVDTGTGLIPFIKGVVSLREIAMEVILDAIAKADEDMYAGGIVAVGDISNKLDTAAQKDKSKIRYYSFVEMFDFLQDGLTETEFNKYHGVYEGQSTAHGNRKSCVPHAPYTVSPGLFQRINAMNTPDATVSIHNQETPHENQLFLDGGGDFLPFFSGFGFNFDHFKPTGKTSIHYALANMDPRCRTLFVHNTLSTPEDIRVAQAWSDRVFWATCANANLYIENRLPNYQHFIDTGAVVTIGTDSLTSNWQLSVLEEMKTIARYQSGVSFQTLLQWATLNGAKALGFDTDLGSIEVGKQPGLLSLNIGKEAKLTEGTKVTRVV